MKQGCPLAIAKKKEEDHKSRVRTNNFSFHQSTVQSVAVNHILAALFFLLFNIYHEMPALKKGTFCGAVYLILFHKK
jgi:uncharacterized membrane protein